MAGLVMGYHYQKSIWLCMRELARKQNLMFIQQANFLGQHGQNSNGISLAGYKFHFVSRRVLSFTSAVTQLQILGI